MAMEKLRMFVEYIISICEIVLRERKWKKASRLSLKQNIFRSSSFYVHYIHIFLLLPSQFARVLWSNYLIVSFGKGRESPHHTAIWISFKLRIVCHNRFLWYHVRKLPLMKLNVCSLIFPDKDLENCRRPYLATSRRGKEMRSLWLWYQCLLQDLHCLLECFAC